jgi:hypothetical protein
VDHLGFQTYRNLNFLSCLEIFQMLSMTRTVASCTFASLAFAGSASAAFKVMQACDFSTGYTAGVVNTAAQYTAGTAGQGGWFTSGGANTFFNIVTDPTAGATRGNTMSIQGSSTGTARNAWTNDVASNWASRDSDSDTIVAAWDQDTSTYTTVTGAASTNRFGAVIYDSTNTKILTGLYIQVSTGNLYGLAYATSGGTTSTYAYGITVGGVQVVLARDAWQSLAVTFNKTTGTAGFYYKKADGTWGGASVTGAAAGVNPNRFNLYESANSSTSQGKAYYDNILVSSGSGAFVPAPGAVALLGVAGLIGARRRR